MIHINPHNYEAFFLLYADGELNAADRLAVEQFAAANPDLGVELDFLLQLRLPADERKGLESLVLIRKGCRCPVSLR